MRQIFIVFFVFYVTTLSAQVTDIAFIKKWLLLCDEKIQVDSVRAYYIDRDYFYTPDEINARLNIIPVSKIKSIRYSKMKTDNYVPGRGSIFVMTIQKMDTKDVEGWMKEARKLYVDNYSFNKHHILTDSKDPVLVIDGQAVSATIAKSALEKIDPKRFMTFLSITLQYLLVFSDKNAKNGLVQIWTRQKYRD